MQSDDRRDFLRQALPGAGITGLGARPNWIVVRKRGFLPLAKR